MKAILPWLSSSVFVAAMAALTLLPQACYYDIEERLYPDLGCDTAEVTYSLTVAPIISENCLICHSQSANFGGVTLEGYDNLKIFVDNGRLLGAIRREEGFAPMPQGADQLPECTIQKIEVWVAQGAPDN